MKIKVLGPGCMNCKKLYQLTEEALKDLGKTADIEKVEDMMDIMKHGIMKTPGLVVNDKIKSFGKIPSKDEIKKYIEEEA